MQGSAISEHLAPISYVARLFVNTEVIESLFTVTVRTHLILFTPVSVTKVDYAPARRKILPRTLH